MRPKFAVAIILVSVSLLGAAFWLKKGGETTRPVPASNGAAGQPDSFKPSLAPVEPVASAPAVTNPTTPEQERAAVEATVERLTQLSLKHDPASVPQILGALTHPDREVREAAIDAITQVGDSNAIPALKAASEMVSDPQEKIAFLEAMEFLSVPPLTFDNTPKTPEQIAVAEGRSALRRMQNEREEREYRSHRLPVTSSLPSATGNP